MIYQFDEEESLESLKQNFEKIERLNNSISDSTLKYRDFFNDLGIGFSIVKEIVTKAENSLLIECYTFSERLLKNTVYQCLNFDGSENEHINYFMRNKINPVKFSPNVTFQEFEKELSSLSGGEFKFVLSKSNSSVKIYDEMVKSRHRYAHANEYPIKYQDYRDSIYILEYLTCECNLFLTYLADHGSLQMDFKELREDIGKLNKVARIPKVICRCNQNDFKQIDIKNFRFRVQQFLKKYRHIISSIELLRPVESILDEFSKLDFRKNTASDLVDICTKFVSLGI